MNRILVVLLSGLVGWEYELPLFYFVAAVVAALFAGAELLNLVGRGLR
jgi:hypothetical protein